MKLTFYLSQCNNQIYDFEVQDANDLHDFFMVDDEDDIGLNKQVVDPPLFKIFQGLSFLTIFKQF